MRESFPTSRAAGRAGAAVRGLPARDIATLLAALLLSLAAGYIGYQHYLAATHTTTVVQTVTAQVGSIVSSVTTTGNVVSTKQARLGFSASSTASGKLTEVDVNVGDSVKAGQPLASVDTQQLQVQLAQAQSNLQTAQLNLQKLENGSTPQDIAAAQAAYNSAMANYQQVAAGVTGAALQADQSALDQAQANLQAAQAKLQAAQNLYTAADVAAAKTALDQAQQGVVSAQAKLQATEHPYTQADMAAQQAAVDSAASSLKSAQANLAQTQAGALPADIATQQAAVDQAQANLLSAEDKLQQFQNGDTKTSGFSSNSSALQSVQAAQDAYSAAVAKLESMQTPTAADLQSAQTAVATAQDNYNSAVAKLNQMNAGPLPTDVTQSQAALNQAEATLTSAQADYAKVQAGPLPTDVTQAQDAVNQAQATLASARAKLNEDNAGPKAADVAAAKNTLAQAQANLTTVSGPPLATDVALAQQQVAIAQQSVDQAKLNLANATLTAPFAGVVAAVSANPGEQVGSSPIITLVDPSAVRVDATVDETDVAKLQVGQPATMTFDALPGTTVNGNVIAISPSGTSTQGVVSYLVSVGVNNPPKDLPAGLTSTVTIVTQSKNNVVVVPLRAIHTQGQISTVQVVPSGQDGKPVTRQVQVGVTNDQQAEIVSGLNPGDQAILPTTSTAQPSANVGGGGLGGGGFGVAVGR
jgi:HlyD family secretion protein